MKKRGLLAVIIGLALFFLFAFPSIGVCASGKVTKLVFADYYPPTHTNVKTIEWWGSKIEKRSKGRVKFEYYWNSSLMPAREEMSAIKNNVIQLCTLPSGYFPDLAPITAMTAAPMLHIGSFESSMKATDEFNHTNSVVQKEFENLNVKFLFTLGAADHYLWSKKPIETLSDISGLTVRTYGHFTTLFKALGASLVSVTLPEIYNALERGLVNSSTSYLSPAIGNRVYEVTDYLIKTNLGHNNNGPVAINLDTWINLPDDIKQIIEETNVEASAKYLQLNREDYTTNMNIVKTRGLTISELPATDVEKLREIAREKIWKPVAKRVDAKGIEFTKAWEEYLKIIDKYRSSE